MNCNLGLLHDGVLDKVLKATLDNVFGVNEDVGVLETMYFKYWTLL